MVKLSEIIELQELTSEAQELRVYLNLHNRNSPAPITEVKVSTIYDVMNSVSDSKDCLAHIHQLLKLYMSLPLGSVTAERTFSVMRRVKSWLRSSMSLNNRIFSVIHKQRIDEVAAQEVAKESVEINEQRRIYFGQFQ